MTTKAERSHAYIAVAAIDFGTTYTGYAISTDGDYKVDPLKILTQQWNSDEGCTEKTPTCILFDEDKNFHSFGYTAESHYTELAEDKEHEGWRFFKHFKLKLMQSETQRLKRSAMLKDDQNQPMRALDVFSASIRYIKDVVWKKLSDAILGLKEGDIHWILTVPAIWGDGAKQFMRIATNEAGIADDLLTLALEPEAAAIYCKQIAIQRAEKNDKTMLSAFEPGTKFLLLDLGGGTVDSVVEQVEENGHLTDIHYPDGGPWGGTLVDRAFKQFLRDVFGEVSFEKFSKEYKADELFLYRNFEIKKQNIEPTASKIRLKLPTRLVDCVGGERALQRRIEQSEYRDEVKLNADKLTVDNRVFVRMFSESKEKLLELIRELFQEDEVSGIEIIILVGGFACSQVIKEAVKTEFSNKHVIVPDGANLAMLKGAVLYGRLSLSLISQSDTDAAVITARHMRYTYGISTAVPFDDQKHPQEYKRIFNGIPKCDNIFRVFFKVGQRVMPGQTTETCEFNPTANCIEVYKTRSKAPEYVLDEGCFMVGKVMLEAYDPKGGAVRVTFYAGGTELSVEAKQAETITPTIAKFNFLI